MRAGGIRLHHLAAVLVHLSWALPQTLLGFCLFLVVRMFDSGAKSRVYRLSTVLTRTTLLGGGVSLGMFIFSLDYRRAFGRPVRQAQARMDAHEWGHVVQSCMLGPLYLPVVGVPSIVRAAILRSSRRRTRRHSRGTVHGTAARRDASWYYRGYPEAWADRLAGIDRERRTGFETRHQPGNAYDEWSAGDRVAAEERRRGTQ
ncbi:MAG: hypothetical protein ACOCRN_02170 [Spirochaetia bacterium]